MNREKRGDLVIEVFKDAESAAETIRKDGRIEGEIKVCGGYINIFLDEDFAVRVLKEFGEKDLEWIFRDKRDFTTVYMASRTKRIADREEDTEDILRSNEEKALAVKTASFILKNKIAEYDFKKDRDLDRRELAKAFYLFDSRITDKEAPVCLYKAGYNIFKSKGTAEYEKGIV